MERMEIDGAVGGREEIERPKEKHRAQPKIEVAFADESEVWVSNERRTKCVRVPENIAHACLLRVQCAWIFVTRNDEAETCPLLHS